MKRCVPVPTAVVLGARNLGGAIASHLSGEGWGVAAVARSEDTLERVRAAGALALQADVARAVAYLAGQSPRSWTHELQLTPRGDRWVP